MKKPATLVLFTALLCLSLAFPQQKSLKVLVLYDMEGVTGATGVRHIDFDSQPEYGEARESLTDDVNAAIAGLIAAGATEIVVVDGHGSGNSVSPDVLEDKLLPPAKMISRDRPFDIYMDSYDQSVDAVVAVAMHAGAGNQKGFLSHTYTIEDTQYKVNGIPFNESMILAMGAARYRIPLIMVSGDDQLEKEIRRFLPWVKCAIVKHAVDRSKAEPLGREEASRRIEDAAREGLLSLDSARLPEITTAPFRFALTFQDESQARNAARLTGTEATSDPLTVQLRSDDFEEGYRASLRLISAAGLIGYIQAMQKTMDAQPNGKALRRAIEDNILARWVNPLPAAPPTAAAESRPKRYWGAR
jgi:D-amino peptidase